MNSETPFSGKKVLVTGAGSGIGRAAALSLGRQGATLALLSRTRSELAAVIDEIGGPDAGHLILEADIAEESQMIGVFDILTKSWGALDGVVANAGVNGVWAPLESLTLEDWDQTMAINLRGTFLTTKLAVPLLRQRGGSVVVVASVNGSRMFSNSGATAYACSKAGQVAFAKMMALELARYRIRVNVVCPGAIVTEIEDSTDRRDLEHLHLPVKFPQGQVPLTGGGPGVPEDVAPAIVFLLSDGARHITGTEIFVDGAQSLLQG